MEWLAALKTSDRTVAVSSNVVRCLRSLPRTAGNCLRSLPRTAGNICIYIERERKNDMRDDHTAHSCVL